MKTRQEIASELNEILKRNYDLVSGYKDSARDVENDVLRDFLIKHASERAGFGKEIRNEIMLMGAKPVNEGSTMGMLQRSWMNLKTNLTHDNEKEVCEACIQGEIAAIGKYNDLLKESGISEGLRAELERHKTKSLEAINDLELIRDSFK